MVSTTLTRWSCSNLILSYCWLSHDFTKVQTVKQAVLRFYFHGVYVLEQLKTNINTNFFFERIFGFVVEYTLYSEFRSLCLTRHLHDGRETTGNFEKKTLKQQQSMNKGFWIHLKHFGRLLGKIYLFLTPSKTDGRVPSQEGVSTTCNLTYSEILTADVC